MVGGLGELRDGDAAWYWLANTLWKLNGPQPQGVYAKGDFKGIAFASFTSKSEHDNLVKMLQKASLKEGGFAVWAKPDKPLIDRIMTSIIFGTKYQMMDWGYDAMAMWGDVGKQKGKFTSGREGNISTASVGKHLVITYGSGWQLFLNDP